MKPSDASSSIAHRIRDICVKSLHDLPVGKDVPRLAKKFRLWSIEGDDRSADDAGLRMRVVVPSADSANGDLHHGLDIDAQDGRDGLNGDHCEAVPFLNHVDRYMERYLAYKAKNPPCDHDTGADSDNNGSHDAHAHNGDGDEDGDEEGQEQQSGVIVVNEEGDADDDGPLVLPSIINQITDDELEQQTVVYFLIRSMFKLLSVMTALPHATFPTLEEYHSMVNINDHTTTTEFLGEHFGDYHPLTKLLKATQQTIVINVLYLAREALMKFTPLHFKDVRGQWRVMIMYHTEKQRIVVCHKRTEEVYMKRSMQEMQQARHLGMFKTLFKFTWRVCIEFDTSNDMSIRDIRVELLDIIFSDEQHKEEYRHEMNVVKELFRQMNLAGTIVLSENESVKILNQKQEQSQQNGKSAKSSGTSTPSKISPTNSSSSTNSDSDSSSSSKVSRGFSVLNMFRDLFSGSQRSDSMATIPSARSDRGTSTAQKNTKESGQQRKRSGTTNEGFFKRLFSGTASGSSNSSEQSKTTNPDTEVESIPVTNVETEGMSSPEGSADMDVDSLEARHRHHEPGRGGRPAGKHHYRGRSRSTTRSQSSRMLYHDRKRKKSKRRRK